MARRSQRGNARENAVARVLRADGWIVGSMRQAAGGGDLIASRLRGDSYLGAGDGPPLPCAEVRLVEVKSTAGGPYERFGPRDRLAMKVAAGIAGATAWLAWWPPRGDLRWIPSEEWPGR